MGERKRLLDVGNAARKETPGQTDQLAIGWDGRLCGRGLEMGKISGMEKIEAMILAM